MSGPSRTFHADRVSLFEGDCLAIARTLASNSIDAVVTDPPYALNFMGKKWDTGETAFAVEFWAEILRVLKPGCHVVAFGGTRSYHRLACAIEDAGFEIRDQLAWAYGTGFPKSLDVSKAIDKASGRERKIIGDGPFASRRPRADHSNQGLTFADDSYVRPAGHVVTAPESDAAREWEGWGTALKPAWEPILLARKPLSENTVVANVLRWGTGAINIGATRVTGGGDVKPRGSSKLDTEMNEGWARPWMEDRAEVQARHDGAIERANALGRWPANILHDGSAEVLAAFPVVGDAHAPANAGSVRSNTVFGSDSAPRRPHEGFCDSGSAARFFYSAKADADDRLGSKHPTVKPVDLMQWLCRLVTPPCGMILDPFAGTGTTGEAALREGFRAVLIEREPIYSADIARRMDHVFAAQRERRVTIAKSRGESDAGPLFAMIEGVE